jgi:hypothetical protein
MNTTSKFVVFSALAVLMIGATVAIAIQDASASGDRTRNVGDRNIGQQNTGDTNAGNQANDNNDEVEQGDAEDNTANGGNYIGGDFNCDECNTGDEED